MRWSPADIADAVEAGLKAHAAAEDAEQSVYGFDSRDELGLHPLIQQSLRTSPMGWGVWPEVRYPGYRQKKSKAEGKRCDIILTPNHLSLGNSQKHASSSRAESPLFHAMTAPASRACDVSEAYWLEVKSVAQFEVEGPFRGYTRELMQPVTQDIRKLLADGAIHQAGLLLVLFTRDQQTAEHDLIEWYKKCLDRHLSVGLPAMRGFAITDRIGNGWCSLAVFGVRGW